MRHTEGTTHGFLVLRDLSGKALAAGDLTQVVRGNRLVSRLQFHFRDGSLDDETTVFSQHGRFRLLSDHHIQRGPSYPDPLDLSINAFAGQVTTRYKEKGIAKVDIEHMNLPPDLSNGMLLYVLKNMPPDKSTVTISYLASLPKPRLVKLSIFTKDEQSFALANVTHKATRFKMKVDLGGLTGLIAPLTGKEPADVSLWVMNGDAPAFIRMEGQLYSGGPIWSVEMIAPVWPKALPAQP